MRCKDYLGYVLTSSCILLLCVGASARDKSALVPDSDRALSRAQLADSFLLSDTDWPLWYGMQQTGVVNAYFNSTAQVGRGRFDSWQPVYDFWPEASFESPPGSNAEYLFSGALWIGGVVGVDTLVSTGWDGWQLAQEIYPPAGPSGRTNGSVEYFRSSADFSMRAEYADTLNSDIAYAYDVIDTPLRRHKPLHVSIATRSHAWNTPPLNKGILYDLVITNIGTELIREGYVGLYFDCDIGDDRSYEAAYGDVTGFLADDTIPYVVDADGDYAAQVRVPRAFALKVLRNSWGASRVSYNWWTSNGDPNFDWGPRLKIDARDLQTGGQGTPEGDRNKYHFMSNGEWDFDQIFTRAISPDSSIWRLPDANLAGGISLGNDTRFLYSIGPFTLMPDSSIRLLMTTFADSVHVDTLNQWEHLRSGGYYPDDYLAALSFDSLRATAASFDSIASQVLDPHLPPVGLRARALAADSLLLLWDPWCFPDVEGYNIYLDPVPKSEFVHEGVLPIWYRPPSTSLSARVDRSTRYVLQAPNRYTAYACEVSHRMVDGDGIPSGPVIFKCPTPLVTPQWTDSMVFVRGATPASLTWRSVDGPVRQYNIYRFSDTSAVKKKYSRHYSTGRRDDAADSVWANDHWYYYYALPIYTSVHPADTSWTDIAPADGAVYLLTAVDTAGFETPFSQGLITYQVSEQTSDVLLMTASALAPYNYVKNDSIEAFYRRVLAGYRYDIYSVKDTFAQCGDAVPACIDWRDFVRYKTVIIDDGLRDFILRDWYENAQGGFGKYLFSGGRLIYFGAFTGYGMEQFSQLTVPAWYPRPATFIQRYFGVDSVYFMGMGYYKGQGDPPYVDTIIGFTRAGSVSDLPSLSFDTTRYPFSTYVSSSWPPGTAPDVAAFSHDSTVTETHLLLSKYPLQSRAEGLPVGLHKRTDVSDVYAFGFHLWYMEETKARELMQRLLVGLPTDAEDREPTAFRTRLEQNYPNPFNPTTTIRFDLARAANVRLEVFNILGQKVRTLVESRMGAGPHVVEWQGADATGRQVASGIYLYRLTAGNAVLTRKMVLVR